MKHRALETVLFLLVAAVLWGTVPVFAEVPTYTIKRATEKVVIDGVLDEADWDAAPSTGTLKFMWPGFWLGTIDSLSQQTEVKMMWDDEFLYLAYICHNKRVYANNFTTNSNTWYDSAVEFFWNPTPGTNAIADTVYYQYEFNAIGNYLSVWKKSKYKAGTFRTAIMPPHIGRAIYGTLNDSTDVDSLWVLEMAIRFADYPDSCYGVNPANTQRINRAHIVPQDGDKWKAQLTRCENAVSKFKPEVPVNGVYGTLWSQWAPGTSTAPDFHRPQDFGWLVFSSTSVRSDDRVGEGTGAFPSALEIRGNYPNPFNPSTMIDYALPSAGRARIVIYDISGRKVRTLVDRHMAAGTHMTLWDGRDNKGATVSSGTYLVNLYAGKRETSRKVLLVK